MRSSLYDAAIRLMARGWTMLGVLSIFVVAFAACVTRQTRDADVTMSARLEQEPGGAAGDGATAIKPATPLVEAAVESTTAPTVTPTPESAPDPVIVGAGDIAWCGRSGRDEETAALVDDIPGTVYTVGDTVYESGSAREFDNCYDPTWGRFKDRTRPAVGDHEYRTPGASGYFDYFGAAAGQAGKGWYSYDLGEWHIIVLNSNCGEIGGCGAYSEQGRWLQADLAAHTNVCTLAYWHHPLFSMRDAQETENQYFWPVMYEHGVEVVINGNDHHYARFAPQTPDGIADPDQGVRQFTVGTGGRTLYSFTYDVPNVEARQNWVHGVLKLTLHPGSYEWEFVSIDGSYSDSGSTDCH